MKPALRFTNPYNPAGPHIVEFDGMTKGLDGQSILILDLKDTGASQQAQERFRLALDAIAQNEGIHCYVLMSEDDLQAFDPFIDSMQTSHVSALARTQIALS